MPWRESCAMDQRVSFIADQRSGMWTMTELCERYEISRKTGYKWLDRYQLEGPGGLTDRSHAARVHGRATPQHIVDAIVGLRLERPSWGPRKIVSKLEARQGDIDWPSASTAGEILKRAGLVSSRRPRRRAPPRMGQLTVPQHANHVWALDHKGWIRLGDGSRVEPFTVTDGFSRYLISLAATGSTQYAECQPPLERAFREYGLPQIIRSDNGSPFASTGITGLTALSVCGSSLASAMNGLILAIRSRTADTSVFTLRFWKPCGHRRQPRPRKLVASRHLCATTTKNGRTNRLASTHLPASIRLRLVRCQGGFPSRIIQPKPRYARSAPTARSNGMANSSTSAVPSTVKKSPSRKPRTDAGKCASSTCPSASSTRKHES
jgi:putative transposase